MGARNQLSWTIPLFTFTWCVMKKKFPSSKIDVCPFLKLQKMEFGEKIFSWNWIIWFLNEFFWPELFLIFWPTMQNTSCFWAKKTQPVVLARILPRLFILLFSYIGEVTLLKCVGSIQTSLIPWQKWHFTYVIKLLN